MQEREGKTGSQQSSLYMEPATVVVFTTISGQVPRKSNATMVRTTSELHVVSTHTFVRNGQYITVIRKNGVEQAEVTTQNEPYVTISEERKTGNIVVHLDGLWGEAHDIWL